MLFASRKYKTGSKWAFWRWTDVMLNDELYLRRLHLAMVPRMGAIMLHWIKKADPQPHLHDHPVNFLSIPLWGWYTEERISTPYDPMCRLEVIKLNDGLFTRAIYEKTVRWANFVRAQTPHRIVALPPGGVLTLVFASPKVREWEFWTERGKIGWKDYDLKKEIELKGASNVATTPGVPNNV